MLELDVYLSKDGHLIIRHDSDVSRTTNGKGQINNMTLKQIKELDAGKGERIPTLSEVIDLVRDRANLYIELKGQRTPVPVTNVIQAMDFVDQVIVGSFYPWLIQKIKFLNPMIYTSMLVRREDRKVDFVEWALAVEADYVHPCWEDEIPTPHKLLTPDTIANIRKHGLGLIIWQEERPSELHELVKLGVDGICTNTPDILTKILRKEKGVL